MRGTKQINWSTPKHIQEEVLRSKGKLEPRKPGKRKWPCKKNKGNHVYDKPYHYDFYVWHSVNSNGVNKNSLIIIA